MNRIQSNSSASFTEISSAQNAIFKKWKDLQTSKGIKKHQEFILMGDDLIQEFVRNWTQASPYKITALIFSEDHFGSDTFFEAQNLCKKLNLSAKIFKLSAAMVKELDVLGTKSVLLVLSYETLDNKNLQAPTLGLEVLAPLGDPQNLGAMIRSAKAFGANEVILLEESAHPYHPKTVKASAGAVLNIKLSKGPSIHQLPSSVEVWTLDLEGEELQTVTWPKDVRLLVGEEGAGVPKNLRTHKVKIPTHGVESLNATVATSIAMWEYSRSRN